MYVCHYLFIFMHLCIYSYTDLFTYMKLPHSRSAQVELGKVEGFWSALPLLQKALAKYSNIEQPVYNKSTAPCQYYYIRQIISD